MLCFLGGEPDWAPLAEAANAAIGKFAAGFHVDTRYSQGGPDKRMARSFAVSWDRVAPGAWTRADEDAVADELARRELDDVLRDRKARLSHTSTYAEDDFKFNPFGIVHIDRI